MDIVALNVGRSTPYPTYKSKLSGFTSPNASPTNTPALFTKTSTCSIFSNSCLVASQSHRSTNIGTILPRLAGTSATSDSSEDLPFDKAYTFSALQLMNAFASSRPIPEKKVNSQYELVWRRGVTVRNSVLLVPYHYQT